MTNRENIIKLLGDGEIAPLVSLLDDINGVAAAVYLLEAIVANNLFVSDVLEQVKAERARRR